MKLCDADGGENECPVDTGGRHEDHGIGIRVAAAGNGSGGVGMYGYGLTGSAE